MDPGKLTREQWIEAAFEALGLSGVDKVRVDQLAESLGVTKGSFYWHFKDRGELLSCVVAWWEAQGTEAVIREVESIGSDPQARAQYLWKLTSESQRMRSELGIRDWARRDPAIAAQVARVDERRTSYLEALFSDLGMPPHEVGPRALLAYSLLLGDYLITSGQSHDSRRELVARTFAFLLKPVEHAVGSR